MDQDEMLVRLARIDCKISGMHKKLDIIRNETAKILFLLERRNQNGKDHSWDATANNRERT